MVSRSTAGGSWESERVPHTLIVLSDDPETMVFPSGEKATDHMVRLWALSLLDLSSRVPEEGGSRRVRGEESAHAKSETAHLHPTL